MNNNNDDDDDYDDKFAGWRGKYFSFSVNNNSAIGSIYKVTLTVSKDIRSTEAHILLTLREKSISKVMIVSEYSKPVNKQENEDLDLPF